MIDKAIEEIRGRRRELIKTRYGGSAARLFESAIRWQAEHPGKTVSLRKKSSRRAVA
jgi:hypothetical protein